LDEDFFQRHLIDAGMSARVRRERVVQRDFRLRLLVMGGVGCALAVGNIIHKRNCGWCCTGWVLKERKVP